MQLKYKLINTIILSLFLSNVAIANTLPEPTFTTDIVKTEQTKLSSNVMFKKEFSDAVSKFENLNIKVSYEDFNKLILTNSNNDFKLLIIAEKAAEIGFFDLSNLAFSKIHDLEIASKNIENIKKFYYPNKYINKSDILTLAELYSNIIYNDQSKETVNELLQYEKFLQEYDYANYIMALGYYKLDEIDSAKKYIAIATKQNPTNINYKILEAKIFSHTKKGKISLNDLKEINSQKIDTYTLANKINITNEYIMYLISTQNSDKDYYLGRYYFSENDYVKSSRTLISALGKNKKKNAKIYGVLSRCYFIQGDYDKANEFAQKSYKINKNIPDTLLTLGDLEVKNGHYKNALKYYKSSANCKTTQKESLEKIASVYTKLSNNKRANEIYKELINNCNCSFIAYFKISIPNNEISYLKKSVAMNIFFQDGWIDLARIMMEKGNIELAKNYLSVANYLDDNNFRYYYYQSLLKKIETELNN